MCCCAVVLLVAAPMGAGQARVPVPTLHVKGMQFVNDGGRAYVPRWVSGLTLLARPPAQQLPYLDWVERTGFNGVRVFAGALTWAGQSPESARAALPALLGRAAARSLMVEVTALTDTGTGYDARAHLRAVTDILAGRPGVVLELANEVGHPTQARDLTPARLHDWGGALAAPRRVLWAVGATTDPMVNGDFVTVHVDRASGSWDQVAGLDHLYAVAARLGVPALNNEPIGADEVDGRKTGRQRSNDPALFLAFGAADRASGFGGVHHSQAGLMAEVPGPVQQRCADAYVAGHRAVEMVMGDASGEFRRMGQPGSPVRYVSGMPASRVMSFVDRERAIVVLAGASAAATIRWSGGWRPVKVITTMKGADGRRVDVIHAARVR